MDSDGKRKITLQYICSGKNVLRASTFGGPSPMETAVKYYEQFEVNQKFLETKVEEILGCLHAAARGAGCEKNDGREKNRIAAAGEDLFRELVPASFRAKLDSVVDGDLILSIDSDLAWIPWELLHDGNDFFCRRYNMGRLVGLPVSVAHVEKRQLSAPLRHVAITDPEGNLPGAAGEGVATRDMLFAHAGRVTPVLLSGRVSAAGFMDGLRRADILHVAGHVEGTGDDARLRLSDGFCSVRQIAKCGGRFVFPGLVLVNGCRSSSQEAPLLMEAGQRRALGLATTFLVCGVQHFVGTLWDVRDSVARTAGVAFFRSLYGGRPVGAALREARRTLAEEFGENSMGWGGYVLYGDPSFAVDGFGPSSTTGTGIAPSTS